jgi:cellulose synthase/poly-beta-1,6-N-acetylglucosamine synthase-like glycosyltransferase
LYKYTFFGKLCEGKKSVAFTVFRAAFFAVFCGLHAALMLGLFLERRRDKRAVREAASASWMPAPPLVSVVVPFRNEEARMGTLLDGLAVQNYSAWECVLIDDRSADQTPALLAAFAASGRAPSASVITLGENPGPNHKQYALLKGIEAARGELILFTDADCELAPGWIAAMVSRMNSPRTGAVIGPVFKRPLAVAGFFSLYQCFDHAVRYMYLAASTGLGAAGGGFGNNLILRRTALDAIGGYGAVPPSPTEDAALIARVRSATAYRVRSVCGTDTAVFTAPEASWSSFVRQTLRWNNGGLFSPDLATRCNFGFLMITISAGMLCLPALPAIPALAFTGGMLTIPALRVLAALWPLPVAVLLSMTANTLATLALFAPCLPKAGPAYIIQTIFMPIYMTFLTILGLCGVRPKWKAGFAR